MEVNLVTGTWSARGEGERLLLAFTNYVLSALFITVERTFQCVIEEEANDGVLTLNSQKWK